MKRVIRLTESDLVRIVKRVIAEDATAATSKPTDSWSLLKTDPTPENIAKVIYGSKGSFNDSEELVIAALSKIKDKSMWWEVTKELQKLANNQGIVQYLNSFMEGDDYSEIHWNNTDVLDQLERIFNLSRIHDKDQYPFKDLKVDQTFWQQFIPARGWYHGT
jgi:hypothetical protein